MYHPSARNVARITSYLLIFVALIVTALIIFLNQLDLNSYRVTIEKRISTALGQPVQIGHCSLTFSRGLALSIDDLKIGSDENPLAVIPHTTVTLIILPLLKGDILLDQVRIKNPRVQLHLPLPESKNNGGSNQLLTSLGINILNIDGGHLKIYQKDLSAPSVTISDLNVDLEAWHSGQTGQLYIRGNLDEYRAGFAVETQLPRTHNIAHWRQIPLDAKLTISNLSTRELSPSPAISNLPNKISLEMMLSGTPASGVTITTKLIDAEAKMPILALAGSWNSAPEQETLSSITGELLGIPLNGELSLRQTEGKNVFTGALKIQDVAITPARLKRWYVSNSGQFVGGKLKSLRLELKDNWKTGGNVAENLQLNGKLALEGITWKDLEYANPQSLSLAFSFKNKTLSVSDGTIVIHQQPLSFSGHITNIFKKPQIKLNASASPLLDEFSSQFKLPEGWQLSGHIPTQVKLEGLLSNPHFSCRVDLTPIKTKLGTFFKKDRTDQASLSVQGQLEKNRIQLDSAILTLAGATIEAKGHFRSENSEQTFQLTTSPINFEKLQPFSPLLKTLALRGTIAAEVSQQQTGLQGVLNLTDVGGHLTSVIGDLNKTTGQIDLDRHGLTFKDLHASLGKSELILTGILSHWDNPQLSLDLTGNKIRAHDLIFSNRHLTLYNLKGHLEINKEGLEFSPVTVKLEDETFAKVTGNVRFSNPEVYLNIQSEKANITDVIKLFTGGKKSNKDTAHKRIPVKIEVAAKKGTLGGLHFQNATGLIISDDKRLTIYPLKFDSGGGWCQARIIFEYDNDLAPLIISGHAEGIDASEIHKNFFENKGIITGQLNTDFYLEGQPANNQFWKTAKGGVHAQITNGVLRKFRGLAGVFSILNVSQLFSGNLPDINKEGMPFSVARGSIQLSDGQASTKDLTIDSVAMNIAIIGTSNLANNTLNMDLSVMPLGTVDSVISSIPIAGWILTGKNRALVTAHFKITGTRESPKVKAVPIGSVSDAVIGIVRRTFGLPGTLVTDVKGRFKAKPQKKAIE